MSASESTIPRIQHSFTDKKGIFYIRKDGKRAAHMIYNMAGPTIMIIEHTEVAKGFEGNGYGKILVFKGVEYAG